jgi:Helix-turn-helix domain
VSDNRLTTTGVARLTGYSVRRIQEWTAAGKIPGAMRVVKKWTYDEAKVRAWIRRLEGEACRASQPISISALAPGTGPANTPAFDIDEAFERLMRGKRRNGSRPGARA